MLDFVCATDILSSSDGGCSSMVERLIVVQKVAGSTPVTHPNPYRNSQQGFRYFVLEHKI
jgi:hypothetical protein